MQIQCGWKESGPSCPPFHFSQQQWTKLVVRDNDIINTVAKPAWPGLNIIYNFRAPKVLALPATRAPPTSQRFLLTVSLGWMQSPGHVTAAQLAPLTPSLPKSFCCWGNFLPRKVLNTAEVCNWQPLFWELYYKHLTCIESLNWRRRS